MSWYRKIIFVRKLENAIDWSFIYEMVQDSYCKDNGYPSLYPVILIKLPVTIHVWHSEYAAYDPRNQSVHGLPVIS